MKSVVLCSPKYNYGNFKHLKILESLTPIWHIDHVYYWIMSSKSGLQAH